MAKTNKENKKKEEEKQVLIELVQKNKYKNHTIIGALSKAGLLKQYEEEINMYGKLNIPATITESELQRIIQNYLEE